MNVEDDVVDAQVALGVLDAIFVAQEDGPAVRHLATLDFLCGGRAYFREVCGLGSGCGVIGTAAAAAVVEGWRCVAWGSQQGRRTS